MAAWMQWEQEERENRERLLRIIRRIPAGTPAGWERRILAVGGLMYVGFSEVRPELLVCISSQGQSLVHCQTGEKRYGEERYDEAELAACAEALGDERVRIAGEGGGGLRRFSGDGNRLEAAAPFWPREQVVFVPDYRLWQQSPEECRVVYDGYELRAWGFNRTGDIFVIASASDLTIYSRAGIEHTAEKFLFAWSDPLINCVTSAKIQVLEPGEKIKGRNLL